MRVAVSCHARSTRQVGAFGFACIALTLAYVGGCSDGGDSTGTDSTGGLPGVAASTTSTAAPTTTHTPAAATGEIRQAVSDYWAASRACGQRPARCTPASFTADAGSLRATVQSFVATLEQRGYHFAADGELPRPSTDSTGTNAFGSFVSVETVTVDPVTVGSATSSTVEPTTAQTTECVYDPTPLLGPPDADGRPTVVSAAEIPRRFEHTVYLEGGIWRVGDERLDADAADCSFTGGTVQVVFTNPPR